MLPWEAKQSDGVDLWPADCYRALFLQSPIAEIIIEIQGHFLAYNRRAAHLLDLPADAKQAETDQTLDLGLLVRPEDQGSLTAWLSRIFIENGPQTIDIRLCQKQNEFLGRLIGERINGYERIAQITIIDLNDKHSHGEALTLMAYYDQLTGLPNRQLFFDRLHWAIRDARRHQELLALLSIDLDHFKMINDTLGHQAGDQVLQQLSARMAACLRDSDTLARLGGDEFTVLMQHLADSQDAALVAGRLIDVIRQPIEIMGLEQTVGASIGICLFPNDGDSGEELMKLADLAMYRSKKCGRNIFSFYNEDMKVAIDRRTELTRRLRRASEEGTLSLAYQPILAANGRRIIALEALLRWDSGPDGLLDAKSFLPLADEIGMTGLLSEWALRHACRQMAVWLKNGLIPPEQGCRLSVNLSGSQLAQAGLPDLIQTILQECCLPPERLIIEARESILRQDNQQVSDNLVRLKDMAIQLYLDDFCQGFCSLQQVSRLSFSSLKIDQHFTAVLLQTVQGEVLLATLVELAHLLGLAVIAEGVETEQDAEWLVRHGCDGLQGYFFSRPLPVAATELLLEVNMV